MGAISRWLGVGVLLLGSIQVASAQLVRADSAFGADTVIQDSASGLAWLRIDVTRGMSFNDVLAQTTDGGTYSGFRNATQSEVAHLFDNIGAGWSRGSDYQTGDPIEFQNAVQFAELFGSVPLGNDPGATVLGYAGGCYYSVGGTCAIVEDIGMYWRVGSGSPYGTSVAGRADSPFNDASLANDRRGTWLVTPVPEPSTYALLLAGLLTVALVARRRREL